MNKPNQLRDLLNTSVAHIRLNPDCLKIFVEEGRIVATGARKNLSFEYQFQCIILITDYAAHADTVIVPILSWLGLNQPELLTNDEKRRTGFTFRAEIVNHTTCDIEIKLALTERVIVTPAEQGLQAEHVPEPQWDDGSGINWQLYLNQELQPWPMT